MLLAQHMKCTEGEARLAGQLKSYDWEFATESKVIEEQFLLNSKYIDKNHDLKQDSTFYILSYNILLSHPESAFTAVASYRFETVQLSLVLLNSETGEVVLTEKDGV